MSILDYFTARSRLVAQLERERTQRKVAETVAIDARRELKSFATVGMQRLAATAATDDTSLVESYNRNEIAFACIRVKASAASDARVIVQRRASDGEWEEDVGHPMRRLIMRPNDEMDEAGLVKAFAGSKEIFGRVYCEMVRSPAGAVVELHPLIPSKVTPKYRSNSDGSRTLTNYEWKDGRYQKDIPVEDMLVRKDFAFGNASPLAHAMGSVDLDNVQTDYARSFFNNAGVPSGVIKVHNRSLTQTESDTIRSQFRAKYSRQWGNTHDVAVFDKNADYQQIGTNLDDLDNEVLRGISESRVCMVFQVPPLIVYAYVGLVRATYSNLQEAWRQFWLTTMSGELRDWRSWLTRKLLIEFEDQATIDTERMRVGHDVSEVAALKEDVNARHERSHADFTAGATTVNEFRAETGRPPHPDQQIGDSTPYHPPVASAPLREERSTSLALAKVKSRRRKQANDDEIEDALEEYGEALRALVEQALNGDIGKDEFVERLREMGEAYVVAVFLMGSLLSAEDLTEEELDALGEEIEPIENSAQTFGEDMYNGRYGGVHADDDDDVTADATNRIVLWIGHAAGAAVAGRVWRRDNPFYRWRIGNTEKHCSDCLELDGVVMRASEWRRDGRRPKGKMLKCGGYHCDCSFDEVEEEERSFDPGANGHRRVRPAPTLYDFN